MRLPSEKELCPRPRRHLLPEFATSGPPHDHRCQPLQINPAHTHTHTYTHTPCRFCISGNPDNTAIGAGSGVRRERNVQTRPYNGTS